MPDPRAVEKMFGRIARRYDLLNHTLSLGIDRGWRKALVRASGVQPGDLVIDVCTGTGDLALAFAKSGARVVGVDFTAAMVQRAARKAPTPALAFLRGDALALPIASACARVASIAFGLRNVADHRLALRELRRVLAPGGCVLVLEFSTPKGRVVGPLYRSYFTHLLPRIGRAISGDAEAYDYLPRTVLAWMQPEALKEALVETGFVDCGWRELTYGIACLHWGRVPGGR